MAQRILLVDDEFDMLDMLGEVFRENGYAVETAENGIEALRVLARGSFDLLLSDINMPQMKGFELLRIAQEQYPALKSALITAYNVNDYIALAREQDVGNIICKTSPFNFDEVLSMVRNLITEEVFGIERYMAKDAEIRSFEIKHSRDIDTAVDLTTEFFGNVEAAVRLNIALREIATNAVFYGARNERGDQKENWTIDVALEPDETVKVSYAKDHEKLATAVVDAKGRLAKKDVLFWLDRNITRNLDGTPVNIHDVHGRGLYISRETIDRFIINIRRKQLTEIVSMQFTGGKYKGYRPLLINEF